MISEFAVSALKRIGLRFPKLFERITALILLLRQGLVRHISLVFADPRQRCGHFISFWAFSITPFDPEFRTHKHTDYLLNVLLTLHVDTWSDFQHFPFMPLRGFTNTLQQKIRQNQKKEKKRSHQRTLRCRGRVKMKGLWCIIHFFFYHCHHLFH